MDDFILVQKPQVLTIYYYYYFCKFIKIFQVPEILSCNFKPLSDDKDKT